MCCFALLNCLSVQREITYTIRYSICSNHNYVNYSWLWNHCESVQMNHEVGRETFKPWWNILTIKLKTSAEPHLSVFLLWHGQNPLTLCFSFYLDPASVKTKLKVGWKLKLEFQFWSPCHTSSSQNLIILFISRKYEADARKI